MAEKHEKKVRYCPLCDGLWLFTSEQLKHHAETCKGYERVKKGL